VLLDAKEEMSELVNEAIKGGRTLPANLKPWIDELLRSGMLLDDNGEKITDLSGLQWGAEMKTEAEVAEDGWKKIIALIQKLVETITGPLEDALDDATRDRTIRIGVEYDRERRGIDITPGGDFHPFPLTPGFASGTMGALGKWFADFGRGTAANLHGTEAVLTRNQAVPFSLDTLSSLLPSLSAPALSPALADLSGEGRGVTKNNTIFVAIPAEAVGDPQRMATEVFRQTRGALETDREGLASALEDFFGNYLLSYPVAHAR
jgi:hypothetical protein